MADLKTLPDASIRQCPDRPIGSADSLREQKSSSVNSQPLIAIFFLGVKTEANCSTVQKHNSRKYSGSIGSVDYGRFGNFSLIECGWNYWC